jgi:hypothetical protein
MGFANEQFQLVGSIELPIIASMVRRQVTIMVKFMLIDRPSGYNAMIGRTTLTELRTITST